MKDLARVSARLVVFAFGAGMSAISCGDDAGDSLDSAVEGAAAGARTGDLIEFARQHDSENVASLLEEVDLGELTDAEAFTFLAPNDEAFLAMDADAAADLLSDPDLIVEVLRNHVLPRRLSAAEISELDEVETEAGETLPVSAEDDAIILGGATVVEADVDVGNGVLHVVDQVLLP